MIFLHPAAYEQPLLVRDGSQAGLPSNGSMEDTLPRRISRQAFSSTIILFMVLAVVAAVARTVLRFHFYRRLTASDYLLVVSGVILIIAQGVTLSITGDFYTNAAFSGLLDDHATLAMHLGGGKIVGELLIWAVIYGIKASFAAFFKQLVARVRPLELHWWLVVAFLIAAAVATMLTALLIENNQHFLIISTLLDTISDILLVSVPVRLLWSLQKRLSQKLVIGGILSLSLILVIIAIIRAAFVHDPAMPAGSIDPVWLIYWSCIEADVAVLLLSLTIFRTVFGHRGTAASNANARSSGCNSSRHRPARRFGWTSLDSNQARLNQLPSVTADRSSKLPTHAVLAMPSTTRSQDPEDPEDRKYLAHGRCSWKDSNQISPESQFDQEYGLNGSDARDRHP